MLKDIIGEVLGEVSKKAWKFFGHVGKEVIEGLGHADWSSIITLIGVGASFYALGALSRQPEINKIKTNYEKVDMENERLRFAASNMNDSIVKMHREIDACKAYSYQRKEAKANLKGCITYQYALKEFIEISQKTKRNMIPSCEEMSFVKSFERVLNEKYDPQNKELKECAKIIESFVKPKYREEIENYVEFDCMTLIEDMLVS